MPWLWASYLIPKPIKAIQMDVKQCLGKLCSSDLWHVVLQTPPVHPLLPIAAAGACEGMEPAFSWMSYLQPPSTRSQLLVAGHQAR